MNGTVRDVSFTPDGHYLLSSGSEFKIINFTYVLANELTLAQVMVKFTCGT